MKQKSRRAFQGITILGTFAVTFRQLESQPYTFRESFFAVFFITFAAALALYLLSRQKQWQGRFLDYRCLAEALRVENIWRSVGITASVADGYLHGQREEIAWIRRTLSAWDLTTPPLPPPTDPDPAAPFARVRQDWIAGQLNFFSARMQTRCKQVERLKTLELGFVIAGLAQGCASLFFHHHFMRGVPPPRDIHWIFPTLGIASSLLFTLGAFLFGAALRQLSNDGLTLHTPKLLRRRKDLPAINLLFAGLAIPISLAMIWPAAPYDRLLFIIVSDLLATLAPAAAVVVYAYGRHHAFLEELRLYSRMHLMYQTANTLLARTLEARNFPQARALIHELGAESLAENADWLITHRERPVPFPKP